MRETLFDSYNAVVKDDVRMGMRGELYSYTTLYSSFPKGFESMGPYTVGLVQTREGMMLARLTDVTPDGLFIGMVLESVVRIVGGGLGERVRYVRAFRPVIRNMCE